jgi:hypothetical protein
VPTPPVLTPPVLTPPVLTPAVLAPPVASVGSSVAILQPKLNATLTNVAIAVGPERPLRQLERNNRAKGDTTEGNIKGLLLLGRQPEFRGNSIIRWRWLDFLIAEFC